MVYEGILLFTYLDHNLLNPTKTVLNIIQDVLAGVVRGMEIYGEYRQQDMSLLSPEQ